jgi:predicted ATPase
MAASTPPGIRQIHIRNYKSIGKASVEVPPLCILVGPNGAGKSNFVDALSFVHDCVADSVDLAFNRRGGIAAVRRKSGGHPTHVGIRLVIDLGGGRVADYSFEVAAETGERFYIAHERCAISGLLDQPAEFEVKEGEFVRGIPGLRPRIAPDRLVLFAASAAEEFRPLFDFISGMRFYSIVPVRLRETQEPDPGSYLKRDGSNAAAILKRIQEEKPETYERICRLLAKAVPGIERVEYRAVGKGETLEFKQKVGAQHPWTFDALNMSDGTLRMLGLLLAVFQPGPVSAIAVEEPEATVNPAIADLLVEVLHDAAQERQVIMTTHSPDLLDNEMFDDTDLRVVTTHQHATVIAPLAEVSREAVREHLYTTGELLRVDELEPDIEKADRLASQLALFGPVRQKAANDDEVPGSDS